MFLCVFLILCCCCCAAASQFLKDQTAKWARLAGPPILLHGAGTASPSLEPSVASRGPRGPLGAPNELSPGGLRGPPLPEDDFHVETPVRAGGPFTLHNNCQGPPCWAFQGPPEGPPLEAHGPVESPKAYPFVTPVGGPPEAPSPSRDSSADSEALLGSPHLPSPLGALSRGPPRAGEKGEKAGAPGAPDGSESLLAAVRKAR